MTTADEEPEPPGAGLAIAAAEGVKHLRHRWSEEKNRMPPDQDPPSEQQSSTPPSDEIPPVEDAAEPDELKPDVVADDEAEPPDPAARALEGAVIESDEEGESTARQAAARLTADSDSDTNDVSDIPEESSAQSTVARPPWQVDLEYEVSAHNVVVELKRLELEVRQLLEERDTRRKRKLSGTHRWYELEDDIRSWRYRGRFDEASLDRLSNLISRRHRLFRRLRFLSATRPTWNT